MGERVYNSLTSYFTSLKNIGYRKQSDVNRLLVFIAIQELLDNDFRGLVSEEDYDIINKALYCLYGSTCLIPYPDYYNNRTMRTMYTGSMSELAHRVEGLEKDTAAMSTDLETIKDKPILIPGDEVQEVADFEI